MIRREARDSARNLFATGANSWIDREIAGCEFEDVRLGRRFRNLLEQICDAVGESIPLACQDWANTKAAYRFLANDRVNEEDILSGHFQASRGRFASSKGFIFVLHDTTDFPFQRESREAIGVTFTVMSTVDGSRVSGPQTAALSGPPNKAPGFIGGYLLLRWEVD
jgi:hypothetical protein